MRSLFSLALVALVGTGCGNVTTEPADDPPDAGAGPDDPDAGPPPLPPDAAVDGSLVLDGSAFFVDSTGQWWTEDSGPTLAGTVAAPAGTQVAAFVGGQQVGPAATITGDAWSLALPAGTIATAGTTVIVRIVGAHTVEVAQPIVLDPTGPAVALASATKIRDERGDAIDFASGEPRHDHVGALVTLGAGCPDVYRHAYLMDPGGPELGSEVAPNPLRWPADVVDASTPGNTVTYRVRRQGGATVLDWRAAPAPSNPAPGTARHAIELLRSGPGGIAALGTDDGAFEIDVRATDWAHRTTTATWCWTHHPIGAPLQIDGLGAAPNGLTSYSLLANSPVASLLNPAAAATKVVQATITQTTAEPVRLEIELVPPSGGSYSVLPVEDYVEKTTRTVDLYCGTTCIPGRICAPDPVADPECQMTSTLHDPAESLRTGTLTSGRWSVELVDTAGGVLACETTAALVARCTIPPRAAGAPPRTFRAVGLVKDLAQLRVFGTSVYGEYPVLGLTYTGLAPQTIRRCANMQSTSFVSEIVHTCVSQREYAWIEALDTPTVAFSPIAIRARTSVSSSTPFATPPDVPASQTFPAITWHGGDDDLPGPAH